MQSKQTSGESNTGHENSQAYQNIIKQSPTSSKKPPQESKVRTDYRPHRSYSDAAQGGYLNPLNNPPSKSYHTEFPYLKRSPLQVIDLTRSSSGDPPKQNNKNIQVPGMNLSKKKLQLLVKMSPSKEERERPPRNR
jgi:hypothetical protein